jgi:hypothetical protein
LTIECQSYRTFEQAEQTRKNHTAQASASVNPLELPGAGAPIVLTPDAIRLKQHDVAMAIYMSTRPFSAVADDYSRVMLQRGFANFTPPSRQALAREWLEICYDEVKTEARATWLNEEYLNTVMDENTDVSGNRIVNLSFATRLGSFYVDAEACGVETQSAEFLAGWYKSKVVGFLGPGQWWRVNSLATDTCDTMRAVWEILRRNSDTRHLLFVPCDSHGLQLLINDILETFPYSRILEKATDVVSFFCRAKKQMVILREHQSVPDAFVLSVITRWGTQQGVVASVQRNKDALRQYIADDRAECSAEIEAIITDTTFWASLHDLDVLICGISYPQKISESSRESGGVHHVHERWSKIGTHIENTVGNLSTFRHPEHREAASSLIRRFYKRRTAQLSTIHTVAHHLNPSHIPAGMQGPGTASQRGSETCVMTAEDRDDVLDFLELYAGRKARLEFNEFRGGQGVFCSASRCWDLAESPVKFWEEYLELVPELARFALRLFHAPGKLIA